MVDFTFESLAEDLGTNTADGLRNLANTAANVYCDAYSAYAGAFVPSSSPIGLVRAIDAFNSRLCSPRNKRPPPPPQPFTGGQCPIRYNVTVQVIVPNEPPSTGLIPGVLGPISGVVIDPESGNRRRFSIQGAPDPPGRPDGKAGVLVTGSGLDPSEFAVSILSVAPQSGGPDTCGNPPPGYTPVVAPVDVLNVPVSVNLGGFDLNTTATIVPTLFDIDVDVNAGVKVTIGDFDVNINAGGVTINNKVDLDVNIGLPTPGTDGRPNPPLPEPQKRPDVGCDLAPVETDLSEIKELLEDIKECACDNTEEATISFPAANSGRYSSPSLDIVEIQLNLVDIAPNIRQQWGGENAPDVYYVGWYAFGTAPNPFGDRKPISYVSNGFLAPPGVRSFSYTLQQGCTATVFMTYKRPKPEE